MKLSTRTIAICGVFAALVTIGTLLIRIPAPTGYIHIGDSLVYLSGLLLGPVLGAIASAVGSGLADMYGFIEYVPATVVIKGLDALLTATVFYTVTKKIKGTFGVVIGYLLGVSLGGLTMVSGYFFYDMLLKGLAVAMASVSYNVVQAIGGAIVGLPVVIALEKTNFISRLNPYRSK